MSWLMISKCYEEILADPSLLWLFLEEEWRSIHELPFLGTLWFLDCIGETFCSFDIPITVGKAGVEFITSNGQKISSEIIPMAVLVTDGVEEGSLGMVTTFCSPWPGKGGALRSALHLSPVRLTQTEHSGGEDIHQFTLPPMGVFQLPLSGCNHSFSGHVNHPIPTGLAAPMQAAPLFIHSGHPAMWEGWRGAKSLSIPLGSIVGKLQGGPPPVRSCAAVSPSLFLPSLSRRELTDWRRGLASAQLWCSYKALPGPKPNSNES